MYKNKLAFTLAEMMVVMLILTIVLAAFAPLMTKRKTVDLSSPWRYATNNSDIYYGLGAKQAAMIGQSSKELNDPDSRLIIKTDSDAQAHISFKNVAGHVADLLIKNEGSKGVGHLAIPGDMRLGGPYNSTETGGANTAFGLSALRNLSGGGGNTAIGNDALASNTTGSGNVAIGNAALTLNTTGNNNIALGGALALTSTSSFNIGIGSGALSFNQTGENNIGIGYNAVHDNKVGSNITAIGYNACANVNGSNKTCIGANSGPNSSSAYASDSSNFIYLGDQNTKVIIPGELLIMGKTYFHAQPTNVTSKFEIGEMSWDGGDDNRMRLKTKMVCPSWYSECSPSTSWSSVSQYYSDRRLKNVGSLFTGGLSELKDLPLYNYTYKDDKEKTPHVGVIAQDLQKIFPDAVTKDDDGYLKIRWDDMFYAVINSVKQLDTLVQGVLNELKVHIEKISGLDNRVKALEKENKLLKEQIADINKRLEKLEK